VTVQLEGLPGAVGNIGRRRGTLTLGVYTTGGVPVTPEDFNLKTLDQLDLSPRLIVDAPIGFCEFDKSAQTVKAYHLGRWGQPGGWGAEFWDGADLSGTAVPFTAEGEEH
jgi:hypothetical protein